MSDIDDLTGLLIDARREIAELRRTIANTVRVGTVAETDAAKGYRLDFGIDDRGQPKLSPWLPHPEQGAASRSWVPLAVGQVVTMLCPSGDPRQGVLLRAGFCDRFEAPSQALDEVVFDYGDSRIEVRKDDIKLKASALRRDVAESDDVKAKVLRFMGIDRILMQARNTMLHLFTKGDVLIEARNSITLMAPVVNIVQQPPPDRPDLLED